MNNTPLERFLDELDDPSSTNYEILGEDVKQGIIDLITFKNSIEAVVFVHSDEIRKNKE